jgi:hypothetical protein
MKSKKTNIEKLQERIKQNFDEFRADTLKLIDDESDSIFEKIQEITAKHEVYERTRKSGWINESEAAYLLKFAEPLKMLADALEEFIFDSDIDFRMIVEKILDDENKNNYATFEYVEELKRKHGNEISFKAALLLELTETMEEYEQFKNMIEKENSDYYEKEY